MKINTGRTWQIALSVVTLAVGMCVSSTAFEPKENPGTFSFGAGIAYATEQTTTWGDGDFSTSTGETQTKLAWSADYKYPLSEKLRVGISVLKWQFDPSDSSIPTDEGTSFCGVVGYMLKPDQEVYLGVGPEIVRIGGRFYRSSDRGAEKGLYFSAEFDAPLKSNYVDTFGSIGVGYSF